MRKFSDDDYEELHARIEHKINNLLLLLRTHINVRTMGRKMVWRKQRAKEEYLLLVEILRNLPEPKE